MMSWKIFYYNAYVFVAKTQFGDQLIPFNVFDGHAFKGSRSHYQYDVSYNVFLPRRIDIDEETRHKFQ